MLVATVLYMSFLSTRKQKQIVAEVSKRNEYQNKHQEERAPLLGAASSSNSTGYGSAGGNETESKKNGKGKSKKEDSPSLFRVLASVFGPNLLISWACKVVNDVVQFINPSLLK